MERPSLCIVRFPVGELRPGPLNVPELIEADIELAVLEPNELGARAGAPADPTLTVRSSDRGVRVRLIRPGGVSGHDSLSTSGSVAWWTFREPAGELEVEIPTTVLALCEAQGGPAPVAPVPEPDWDKQLQDLWGMAAVAAMVDDGEVAQVSASAADVRRRIEARREAWPYEPSHGDRVPASHDRDLTWGRAAVEAALVAIEAAGLAQAVEPYRPAARLVTHPMPRLEVDQLPVGISHLHAAPHVPLDFEWPTWECPGYDPGPIDPAMWHWRSPGGAGPLTFVAQVDLASSPLGPWWTGPVDGWLLLFLDHDRQYDSAREAAYLPGAHRVVYVPAGLELEARIPPWDDPHYGRWGWVGTDPAAGIRYIGYGCPAWITVESIEVLADVDLRRAYTDDPKVLPADLRGRLSDAAYRASREWHWLGGEPNPCQDDPLGEALRNGLRITDDAALEAERVGWVQLLQLASDPGTHTSWGDAGLLHVFIRRSDLAAGRFDQTLLAFQCS